mgnify:CR=1 FL=1
MTKKIRGLSLISNTTFQELTSKTSDIASPPKKIPPRLVGLKSVV